MQRQSPRGQRVLRRQSPHRQSALAPAPGERVIVEILDYTYLNDLVIKTQRGSSNAFAELYAATCQRQYAYSFRCLKDADLAKEALQESFIRALKGIGRLQSPDLFIAWLGQINFRVCYGMLREKDRDDGRVAPRDKQGKYPFFDLPEEEMLDVDNNRYMLRQVMNLPLVESQTILMKYYQNMNPDEIGDTMNMSRSTVRRYLRAGKKHLQKMTF